MGSTAGAASTTTNPGAKAYGRPGRARRVILAAAVALVVIVAGYAVYGYEQSPHGATTLVIYTYSSLLGGGCGAAGSNVSNALAPFARAHDVTLEVECPEGTLANTLIAEKNAPVADLVIGLDEVSAPQAEAAGVLVPYTSPELANVSPALVAEISPDHAVTPYEWGYLGIDYCPAFSNATDGAVGSLTFPELASNASWARNLIVEDPTTDIVGEEFLLWEIQYYTQVLHQPWQPFWSSLASAPAPTSDSWDDAFAQFTCAPKAPQMVVSFLNDPAYSAYFGAPGALNSSASYWNGTAYGWKTIYSVGIVQGSHHLGLDREFVDWFLQGSLQSQLPTTEWEFPANGTVAVPSVYHWAMDPAEVHALNDGVTPAQIGANIDTWLTEWQETENAA
jgi:ABC transporter substrate-binding protein (ThiB subfamily)